MNRYLFGVLISGFLISFAQAKQKAEPCSFMSGKDGYSERVNCLEPVGYESFRVTPKVLSELSFENDLATVHNKGRGWLYVNRKGDVIISGVPVFDNGPDWFHDGLVRYERKGKCGYADRSGKAVVVPQYDGCLNFEEGVAKVCKGCHLEVIDKEDGHSSYVGGEWFCLNSSGIQVSCAP